MENIQNKIEMETILKAIKGMDLSDPDYFLESDLEKQYWIVPRGRS